MTTMQSFLRITLLVSAPLGFVGTPARAADDAAALFKKEVRPLLERKCFECHSSKADEVKGDLKLETVDAILRGGANGPAVEPGNVEGSFLLRAVRYEETDYQMPPSGRLSDEEIAKLEAWVKALAPSATKVAPPTKKPAENARRQLQ
jgi:mono/diheme cytochrome c family protein